MSDATKPTPPSDYDFDTICTEAIFFERNIRVSKGELFTIKDVRRIIGEQRAKWLAAPGWKAPEPHAKGDSSQFGDRRRIPPTPEQVTAYSAFIGYPMDGQAWCDAYASKGWKVGKAPMKDWQAAVRTWRTQGYGQNGIALKAARSELAISYAKF